MSEPSIVVVCLPVEACPNVIGALWAAAAGASPDDKAELLSVAAKVQFEHCRALNVDPAAVGELLFSLPHGLRRDARDHLSREARRRASP